MVIRHLSDQPTFITKDGSHIREILNTSNAPVRNQSLADAKVDAGCSTERHYHKLSEEFYFILSGSGVMEVDGITKTIGQGDAVLIPAGSSHRITAMEDIHFLCCCAPPYTHDDTYFQELERK
jgi:mannose-6-phosphate isomerase-like protein (cupin superfamily)